MKHVIALVLSIAMVLGMLSFPVSAASCKHRRTSTECYRTKYIEDTETKHIRKKYYKEICKKCDKTLDRWTEEKELSHRFDGNICKKCGYEKREEPIIVLKNGSKTVYVDGQKVKWEYAPKIIDGTTMVPLVIAVEELGGSYIGWDSDLSQATVELENSTIEYRKNNTRYWIDGKRRTSNEKAQIISGKLYVELKTLLKVTDRVANYKDGYVVIAPDWVSQEEIEETIGYLFGKTSSKDNVEETYEKNEVEKVDTELEAIKAGKVYAVGTEGKHIYKRTYDASKKEQYVDVYVCTVLHFDLPANSILYLEGNYLYSNDEKICAAPDVMKEADKRIIHLNKIIEGANNAYKAGNIGKTRRNAIISLAESTISEYKEIQKGYKTISNVSEVKKSYIAKVGQKNDTIEEIQNMLYSLGYTSQLITGYYGDITFNNIAYFQIINGLTVTGWLDTSTYSQLTKKFNEVTAVPFASIEQITSDRDGIVTVHAVGNDAAQKLTILIEGDNFSDSIIVDDCEAWLVAETPRTGSYKISVTAYAKNGKSYTTASEEIEVSKYNLIQKVFEDMSEETEIGYEIQLGVLKGLADNLLIEPAVSFTNALDYVYNYPNTYDSRKRAQNRAEYITEIENNIESALPYGTEYYYAGQALGETTSIVIDTVLIINGVEALVTGIKQLPNGVKLVTAQIANATTGCYETVQIVVDGATIQSSAAQIAKGAVTFAVAIKSGSPSSEWKDVSEVNDDTTERPSSRKLADNMEAAGRYRPRNYKTAAHHIVAGNSKKAQEARDILKRFGIGINDEANGVFLTIQKDVPNSAYHPSLHTYEYYEKVNYLMSQATSREDVIAILQDIAEQLSAGTF